MDQELRTDGELLAAFVGGDQEAFAAVTRRHGRLVMGICRRVLGPVGEIDDATQAVWLTLARKAPSLRRSRCIAAWLHHVARCIARNARTAAATRAAHEQRAAAMPYPADPARAVELREALDQALGSPARALPRAAHPLPPRGALARRDRLDARPAGGHGRGATRPRPRPAALSAGALRCCAGGRHPRRAPHLAA